MTIEELRQKIEDILVNCKSDGCAVEYCAECEGNPIIAHCREKQQADALIAAGLTFDKTTAILTERRNGKTLILKAQYYDQMKHRAEVAEAELSRYTEMIARDDIYRRAERAEARVSELEKQIKMAPLKLFKMRRKKK